MGPVTPLALGASPSGAHRTAALFCTCSGIDRRFPTVPLRALPPDLPAAAHCDHGRCQSTVETCVPLLREFWFQGCQVVEPFQDFPTGTVRAVEYKQNSGEWQLSGVPLLVEVLLLANFSAELIIPQPVQYMQEGNKIFFLFICRQS